MIFDEELRCPGRSDSSEGLPRTPSSPSDRHHQKGCTSPDAKEGSGMFTGAGNVKGDAGERGVGQLVEGVVINPLAASLFAAVPEPNSAGSSLVHACFAAGHATLRKMHGYVIPSADIAL